MGLGTPLPRSTMPQTGDFPAGPGCSQGRAPASATPSSALPGKAFVPWAWRCLVLNALLQRCCLLGSTPETAAFQGQVKPIPCQASGVFFDPIITSKAAPFMALSISPWSSSWTAWHLPAWAGWLCSHPRLEHICSFNHGHGKKLHCMWAWRSSGSCPSGPSIGPGDPSRAETLAEDPFTRGATRGLKPVRPLLQGEGSSCPPARGTGS